MKKSWVRVGRELVLGSKVWKVDADDNSLTRERTEEKDERMNL